MPRKNNKTKTKFERFQLKNSCDNKQNYPTEQQARQAAECQMLLNQYLELDIYYCNLCQAWHLTRLVK